MSTLPVASSRAHISDSGVLPVIGPLWQPASTSGVTFPGCSHVAPDSCRLCDGTAADEREAWTPRQPEGRRVSRAEFMQPPAWFVATSVTEEAAA